MSWEVGQYYRGRAVQGEFTIKRIDNEKGTRYVEGLIEVTMGPQAGQRVRYRGYVNSTKNVESTAAELRAMGCKMQRWGDWSGIGTKECQFRLFADEATDGSGKLFYRAAFVREVPTIDRKNSVSTEDLDDLNERMPPPPPANKSTDAGDADDLPI